MKRSLRTTSRGLTLGAGLAVLWLILGSHALFFTACVVILYSLVLPIVMMRSIDVTGVSVLVKRQLVMMGKPDMVSVSLTSTGHGAHCAMTSHCACRPIWPRSMSDTLLSG